jgi:hypothetical protein
MAFLKSAGYQCDSLSSENLFNVMATSPTEIVLLKIVTDKFPEPGSDLARAIKSYPAPRNTRKLIHLWRPYAHSPEVRKVE